MTQNIYIDYYELILLCLTVTAAYVLRLLFMVSGESNDDWASYRFIQRHKNKPWLYFKADDSVVEGKKCYPVLHHFIISRFPESKWEIIGKNLNPIYDTITSIMLYFISRHYFINIGDYYIAPGISLPLCVVTLFAFNPILLPITARMKAINARSLGLTLTTIYFSLLFGYYSTQKLYFLLFSFLPAYAILISTQFGTQVVIFFTLFLSLLTNSPTYIYLLLAVLFTGFLLPKLGTREAILQFVNHKYWYIKSRKIGTTASNRNNLKYIFSWPSYIWKNPLKLADVILYKFTPIIFCYSAPILVFLIIYLCFFDQSLILHSLDDHFISFVFLITLVSIITFSLTSIPILSFLGQAERYLEYSSPAYCLLFVYVIKQFNSDNTVFLFCTILIFQLLVILCILFVLNISKQIGNKTTRLNIISAVGWIINKWPKANIATVPCKLSYAISSHLYKSYDISNYYKLYYPFIGAKSELGFRYFREDTGGYFNDKSGNMIESFWVFKISPQQLRDKYNITHLVIENDYIDGCEYTWGHKFHTEMQKESFKDTHLSIYRIKP